MKIAPKITVVIPARNRAHTLPACLDSILAQTYPAAEIVVVDDGSIDNTYEIVKGYADRGVVYAQLPKGQGAQAARNYGVKLARCEWIAFQDSDDWWFPHKLAIQVEALGARNFDKYVVVHGDGVRRNELTGDEQPLPVPLTAGKCYANLLLQPAPMFPSLLASRQAILDAGGLDNDCPAYQEWDTSIRLARQCDFIHIHQPLFAWIWHAGDTISKDKMREVFGFKYVVDSHKQEIISVHGLKAWRKIKMATIAHALAAEMWSVAEQMLMGEARNLGFVAAMFFIRIKFFPRGSTRLLWLLTV